MGVASDGRVSMEVMVDWVGRAEGTVGGEGE